MLLLLLAVTTSLLSTTPVDAFAPSSQKSLRPAFALDVASKEAPLFGT
jgi:hypothetical protein